MAGTFRKSVTTALLVALSITLSSASAHASPVTGRAPAASIDGRASGTRTVDAHAHPGLLASGRSMCDAPAAASQLRRFDCYELQSAAAVAYSDLLVAQGNLSVFITALNTCVAAGGDCSYWQSQIDIAYDAMVAAEYAYEDALGAWANSGCMYNYDWGIIGYIG